jgi:hypothetical protein
MKKVIRSNTDTSDSYTTSQSSINNTIHSTTSEEAILSEVMSLTSDYDYDSEFNPSDIDKISNILKTEFGDKSKTELREILNVAINQLSEFDDDEERDDRLARKLGVGYNQLTSNNVNIKNPIVSYELDYEDRPWVQERIIGYCDQILPIAKKLVNSMNDMPGFYSRDMNNLVSLIESIKNLDIPGGLLLKNIKN